jgi:tetratricopeptide (TPR) repeat protein
MLADLLLELKRPAEALVEYEAVLKSYRNRFDALYGSAQAAQSSGDRAKASQYYPELVAISAASADRPELRNAREQRRGEPQLSRRFIGKRADAWRPARINGWNRAGAFWRAIACNGLRQRWQSWQRCQFRICILSYGEARARQGSNPTLSATLFLIRFSQTINPACNSVASVTRMSAGFYGTQALSPAPQGARSRTSRGRAHRRSRREAARLEELIHASGTFAGQFNRRQTGRSSWDEAKAVAAAWEAAGCTIVTIE